MKHILEKRKDKVEGCSPDVWVLTVYDDESDEVRVIRRDERHG